MLIFEGSVGQIFGVEVVYLECKVDEGTVIVEFVLRYVICTFLRRITTFR